MFWTVGGTGTEEIYDLGNEERGGQYGFLKLGIREQIMFKNRATEERDKRAICDWFPFILIL